MEELITMAESLLAHLYSRIKGSQEDVATLSLQYILTLSPALNESFSRLLFDSISRDYISDIDYKCQSVGDNKERPDIAGIDSAGNEVILCEAKFYAGLTSNQPNAYLDRLINRDGTALVFICPEARRISLWNKVVGLCEGRQIEYISEYCVNVDGIAMSLISWNEIIETLKTVASVSAISAIPDISQLEGFCSMMDRTAFIPFSEEDLGPEIAIKEERYYQVIDSLYDKLVANENIETSSKGFKASPYRSGYTRYIKINGLGICIMYSRGAWINNTSSETPFWFSVSDDGGKQSKELLEKLNSVKEIEKHLSDHVYLALHPALNVPLDDVAEDMMNQIVAYIKMLTD